MTRIDKQSLISESVAAIRIGVHPTGKEPDQHVLRVTPGVSRTTTVRKSLLSQTWATALGVKSWPLGSLGPTVVVGCLILSPTNHLKQGGTVRQSSYKATRFTGAHKPDMWSVQMKACHQGQNDVFLNRHKWGLPPWNLGIATTLSSPFPFE
jgi:hypothetical protein